MAESDIASITENIKQMLNLSSVGDNSPEAQSPQSQGKKKKKNRTPKEKKQHNNGMECENATHLESNITDSPNLVACGGLSISIDRQGNRTSHELPATNLSKDNSTVKSKKNQSKWKKGTPNNKPKGNDSVAAANDPKANLMVTSFSERRTKSSSENIVEDGSCNKNSNTVPKQSRGGKKPNSNDKKEVNPKHTTSNKGNETESIFKKNLEKNWIFPLRKKSIKFPRANFFCRICSYHLDLEEDCNRHMGEKRHQRRKEVTEAENILRFIPKPTQKQLEAISILLQDICQQQMLSVGDKEIRISVMNKVKEHVKQMIPDIEMKIYGSSISGFGLKTSDINIYVYSHSSKCMPKVLVMIYELLKKSGDLFKNVENDFYSKVPAVIYEDPETSTKCQLTINSSLARETSQLLSVYSSVDHRVANLGVIFRIWAKICGLDRQKEGTLPAYSLSLMTIYYLQNTSPPVIPTYHKNFPKFGESDKIKEEWLSSIITETATWKSGNTESLGELWLGLLRFYVLTFDTVNDVVSIKKESLSRSEKKWNSKKLAIEDPFAPKLNVARTVSNAMIYEYLQDTLRKAYHYFGLPRDEAGESWIPMKNLETLAAAFALEDYKQKDTLSATTENSQEIAQDNDKTNNSVCANGTGDSNDHYIRNTNIETNTSSSTSLLLGLSTSNNPKLTNCGTESKDTEVTSVSNTSSLFDFARNFAEQIIDHALKECTSGTNTKINEYQCEQWLKCNADAKSYEEKSIINPADYIDLDSLQDKQCFYQFTEHVLSDGKGLPVICGFCEGEGHLKDSCPEDVLPTLQPLPGMTNNHLQVLSKTLQNVIFDFAPSIQERNLRKRILGDVEVFIQRYLYPDACLQLFGSSCNGFGFTKSDLDICLTFKDRTSEGLDYVQVIKNLAAKLEKHDGLRGITAITTAKVPIVKFRHKQSGLEGDISLYNTLAQHNTKLLEAYSYIDERVSILGYAFKVFAKICDIGDASKGSLSSYAYVLMLLHYLQQCEPPVIPVLQELYTGDKPQMMIEGWNVWFFEDLKLLPVAWPGLHKNSQGIGELWLGLFKYYSEFPIKDNVINIRQRGHLTRFEKLWNGECLAIEDPFDLSHNLGGGLSKKMNNYILHALINARELYGTPFETIPHLMEKYITPADYFFDPLLLTEGRPPNDRGCRECGKIGHIAKKCPQHLKNIQRRKESREMKYKEQRQQQQNQHQQHSPQQHHHQLKGHQQADGVYNDRNIIRNSPNRDQRRRTNSYNEPNRDKNPLLPIPVMRQKSDSHPGTRAPPPLMSVKVDNSNKTAGNFQQIHTQQVVNLNLLMQNNILQIQQQRSCLPSPFRPATASYVRTSGCQVLTPLQLYTNNIHVQQLYKPSASLSQQQGPNSAQNYNSKSSVLPRHKNMYVSGPSSSQGRPH